jgi:hypothetical protein
MPIPVGSGTSAAGESVILFAADEGAHERGIPG